MKGIKKGARSAWNTFNSEIIIQFASFAKHCKVKCKRDNLQKLCKIKLKLRNKHIKNGQPGLAPLFHLDSQLFNFINLLSSVICFSEHVRACPNSQITHWRKLRSLIPCDKTGSFGRTTYPHSAIFKTKQLL